jgi:hypothetical protein
VPDEFPTLEVVAALGFAIVVIRTYQLHASSQVMDSEHAALTLVLRRGNRRRAAAFAEKLRSAQYRQIALPVVEATAELSGTDTESVRSTIAAVLAEAEKAQIRRISSGRARDLLALVLLVGLAAYLVKVDWALSPWVYALLAAGGILLFASYFLRRSILNRLRKHRDGLLEAAISLARARAPALAAGACAQCEGTEYIAVEHPEKISFNGEHRPLGVAELLICRNCGSIRGHVHDPRQVPVGPEHGTSLRSSLPDEAEDLELETREHEG